MYDKLIIGFQNGHRQTDELNKCRRNVAITFQTKELHNKIYIPTLMIRKQNIGY